MNTSAQRISVNRARLFLPLDGQWRQDVGANLVVDGDMESPIVTPPWTLINCTGEKRTDTPYSGSRYLRLTRVGTSAIATQLLPTNTYYHFIGKVRSSGTSQPIVFAPPGSVIWLGAIGGPVWQDAEAIWLQGADNRWALYASATIGDFVDYDDFSVIEYPLTSRNVGSYPGAPSYIRMGDGHVAASVPTQRSSCRGVSLSGTSYLRVPMDYEYNEPFTISVLTDSILPAASWLAATYDSATGRGIRFGTTGSGALVAGLFDTGGRSITRTSANNTIPTNKQPRLYTLSYDGGLSAAGLTMRIDDMIVPAVGGGTALASSISSGRDLLLGARWNAATPTEIMAACNVYCAASFDTVLDAYEIRMLRAQMMREIRV